MILALCTLSLFVMRVAAGFERRAVPAFAFRKPLNKKYCKN